MVGFCRCLLVVRGSAAIVALTATIAVANAADSPSSQAVADQVDQLILQAEGVDSIELVDDFTFLRRAALDIVGVSPKPGQITAFGLNPSADKRHQIIDQLLDSERYAQNWARYWRDAMFVRATNSRSAIAQPAFEEWMTDNLSTNKSWDDIVDDLLTATGDVNTDGSTALMFIHEGQPEEIAAEASRLFMGVQIQCANCHDHPWDRWKREEFHEFVAFFPRVSVRRDPSSDRLTDWVVRSMDQDRSRRTGFSRFLLTRLDRNRDNVISESESNGTPLQRVFGGQARSVIDKDGDGKLTIQEIMTAQPPDNNRPGQGSTEHYMADLSDPASKGTQIDPAFFINDRKVRQGMTDVDRRSAAARLVTGRTNPWFARAIVNRMWAEFTGVAFYEPIDDLGPDRSAMHEEALNVLCEGFVSSGHDLKWLIRTITLTRIYQRPINADAEGFIRCEPVRLRADQLYDVLCQTLNVDRLPIRVTTGRGRLGGRNADPGRRQFAATFGFDPSVPKADLTGNIPESLFMMNSPLLENLVRAGSPAITQRTGSDEDLIREMYLTAVSREPDNRELSICVDYLDDSDDRRAAREDILWSLINSSEFMSKR